MPLEFFGFSLGKTKKKNAEEKRSNLPSFVEPNNEDGASVVDASVSAGGYFGAYIDFNSEVKTEVEFINRYREMVLHPEVESAVEDICNETIVYDDEKQTVELDLEQIDELSDSIKDKMHKEFDYLYHLLTFSTKGFEIFRRWYVDGRIFYHMVVDPKNPKLGVQDVRFVDPTKIKKVVELEKDTTRVNRTGSVADTIKFAEEYYLYRENPEIPEAVRIAPEAVCYVTSGLYDASNKKVISYLHKAIKPLNQLRMLEDAAVIYRISRAPERRVFYIDVGSLPKTKAEQYVKTIMNKYRNKLVYDANTGAIKDDKRHMSMLEDYWLPRREGGKGTEISTLDGGQNLGEMEDVIYFQTRLYDALNIPRTRMQTDDRFGVGRASEISRDEVKFMKYINRLRIKFNDLFLILLKTQCLTKGIMTDDEWEKISNLVRFQYCKDNHFAELKDFEVLQERTQALNSVNDYIGKYFSVEWIRKNLLRQTEEEIKEMDRQIAKEREEGIIPDEAEY